MSKHIVRLDLLSDTVRKLKNIHVIDGDTVIADVLYEVPEIETTIVINARIRLARINTPELRGVDTSNGYKVKEWVSQYLASNNNKIGRAHV